MMTREQFEMVVSLYNQGFSKEGIAGMVGVSTLTIVAASCAKLLGEPYITKWLDGRLCNLDVIHSYEFHTQKIA